MFNSLHFWLAGMAESSQKEEEHASDFQYLSQSLTSQFLQYLPKSSSSNGQWEARPDEEQFCGTDSTEPSTSSAYRELDSCALFSDTASFLDTISPTSFPQAHCQAQWWKCSLQDSLLDAMAEPELVSHDEKLGDACQECLLSILKLPSFRPPSNILETSDSRSRHYEKK